MTKWQLSFSFSIIISTFACKGKLETFVLSVDTAHGLVYLITQMLFCFKTTLNKLCKGFLIAVNQFWLNNKLIAINFQQQLRSNPLHCCKVNHHDMSSCLNIQLLSYS